MEKYLTPIDELLTQPVKYYKDLKGKDIRKIFCNILGKYYGIDKKDIDDIDEVISMIHNASLVIDDIEDNSYLRRNNICAHIKYGIPMALNAGYLSIFKALHEINKSKKFTENIRHKIIENIYYCHIGQGMDIYYTTNKIIPLLDDYNKMIEYKTGMYFITILDLMIEKTNDINLKNNYDNILKCIVDFSLFFQIRDDYINLTDVKYWKEKGFCQDFDEQKISYLITYCTNNKMNDYKIINSNLEKPNKTNEDKIKILMLMSNNGLLNIIYDKLVELKNNILSILNLEIIFEQLPFNRFNIDIVKDYIK